MTQAALVHSVDRVLERTRLLMARREALCTEMGRIMSDCARVRRLPPRVIRGGASADRDDGLRRQVRSWLAEGRLPIPGAETWVGAGSGRDCAICAASIGRTQIEYEVSGPEGWLYVHLACFTMWKSEAAAGRGPASSNGAAAAN